MVQIQASQLRFLIDIENVTIKLLHHHVRPAHPWREFGVFDAWKDRGLLPTLRDVQKIVIPKLKEFRDSDGKPQYPFLTKDINAKHTFVVHWLESYIAFLSKDYEIIPDFDPKTGMANKDHLCEGCLNWEKLCQSKTNPNKEKW